MTEHSNIPQLVDHLFRHESGRLVAVLTRIFGIENLDMAEDVVQDSLVEAMTHWEYKGIPDNPSAWLFRVAKNKALNIINREGHQRKYISSVAHLLRSELTAEPALNHLFSKEEIQDDQLRMIFTCCHPSISPDSQIALALKTLCGFSIPEIARAFLTTEDNINKRLKRARQTIRETDIPFEIPQGKELDQRLDAVLETIYLLFNEGYSASKGNDIIRYELCEEAIRLAQIVTADKTILQKGNAEALLALMFLNASRFKARQDSEGHLLTLEEQDRSLWDGQLTTIGLSHLQEALQSDSISPYHILAAISAGHSLAPDYNATDWNRILSLYDSLIALDNSPVICLNRAIAVAHVNGPREALIELEKINDNPAMDRYYLFHSTKAEFLTRAGEQASAAIALEHAIRLAPLSSIKELLAKRLARLTTT
jgi:RNA polymerase sigma-70 factor (ECF subfamily)